MKLTPMGNSNNMFHEGGLKTHIGDEHEDTGLTLCGREADYFDGPDGGINLNWIRTGGNEVCKKCARIAIQLIVSNRD